MCISVFFSNGTKNTQRIKQIDLLRGGGWARWGSGFGFLGNRKIAMFYSYLGKFRTISPMRFWDGCRDSWFRFSFFFWNYDFLICFLPMFFRLFIFRIEFLFVRCVFFCVFTVSSFRLKPFSGIQCVIVCIYIYMHIYIYIERERERHVCVEGGVK